VLKKTGPTRKPLLPPRFSRLSTTTPASASRSAAFSPITVQVIAPPAFDPLSPARLDHPFTRPLDAPCPIAKQNPSFKPFYEK
jgi:hypothetical protein